LARSFVRSFRVICLDGSHTMYDEKKTLPREKSVYLHRSLSLTMRKKNISVADEHSVEYLAYIFFLKRDNKAKATDSFIEWKHLIYTFSRSIFVSR
jgi:hypothetical protein